MFSQASVILSTLWGGHALLVRPSGVSALLGGLPSCNGPCGGSADAPGKADPPEGRPPRNAFPTPQRGRESGDTVIEGAARILLECVLVS